MRLQVSASGTADSTGKAVAKLGPLRAFETWEIRGIAITDTSSTNIPSFKMYWGSEAPSNLIAGTYKGGLNSDPSFEIDLQSGEVIVGVWENADVGSIGTMKPSGNIVGRQ